MYTKDDGRRIKREPPIIVSIDFVTAKPLSDVMSDFKGTLRGVWYNYLRLQRKVLSIFKVPYNAKKELYPG